jgi:hypothetical protein
MSSLKNRAQLFFYSQQEIKERRKRPKKILDEQTLNNLTKKFNNKFHSTIENEKEAPGRTLTERLGELITTKSVSSANSGYSRHPSAGPNAYTDTRLQG